MNKPKKDNKNRDIKDFIIEKIGQSGFPLERYVANILAENGWSVYSNVHFRDPDETKDRELDIFAEKEEYIEEQEVLFSFYLVIECKKIPGNAWIFFSETSGTFHCPHILTLLDGFSIKLEEPFPSTLNLIRARPHGFNSTGYAEIILNKESNKKTDNLFKAIISILKARNVSKDFFVNSESVSEKIDYIRSGKVLEWMDYGSAMNIGFVIPTIVFEGNMFSADFPMNRKNLREANLVNYYGQYESANFATRQDIYIVNKKFLTTYLKHIDTYIENIINEAKKDLSKLKKEVAEKIVWSLRPDSLPKK